MPAMVGDRFTLPAVHAAVTGALRRWYTIRREPVEREWADA